MRTGDAVKH